MQEHSHRRNRLIIATCVAVTALTLFLSENALRSAALISASLELPQGVAGLLAATEDIKSTQTHQTQVPTAAASSKVGSANPNSKDFDITATPADIAVLMEEAVAEYAAQTRDGDIQAKTYTKKDATQAWGKLTTRNTTTTQTTRDLSKDLAAPLELSIDKTKPAVLIFHTHTTEAFEILDRTWYAADWNSRTDNAAKSIVRVGESIAQMLERAGFQVIHDTTIYDHQYTGAYDKSRAAVQKHLEEYPSIQVVLDVHRDAIHSDQGVRIKPVAQVGGKNAAQVMIITGVEEGKITNYPNWETNLNFATKLQMAAENSYPGLMRPIFFCTRKYNMDLTPYSLLLEMGADVNTLDEATYSGRLIGESLARLLEDYSL